MIFSFGRRIHLWWSLSVAIILTGSLDCISTDSREEKGYRHHKCSSYRNLTFDGSKRDWIPFHDVTDPCSLRCHDVTTGVKVLLESQVPDGTMCRNQTANDTCVNGTCVSQGCEGHPGPGSGRVRCGESSGFQWYLANYSICSVSCGIGFQTPEVKCRDAMTQTTVDDVRCDVTMKPETQTKKTCRSRCRRYAWVTGEWSDCSGSCGRSGSKQRIVFCAEELPDGSFERKPDALCDDNRPEVTVNCQAVECPRWIAGQWSPCTATCSVGIQLRAVACRSSPGVICPEAEKPVSERPCHSGISCRNSSSHDREPFDSDREHDYGFGEVQGRGDYELSDLELDDPGASKSEGHGLKGGGRDLPTGNGRHHVSRGRHRPRVKPKRGNFTTDHDNKGRVGTRSEVVRPSPNGRMEPEVTLGSGDNDRQQDVVGKSAELNSVPVGDNREVSTTPSFVVSSWGQCSAVCGNGIRTRRVQCQVYQETTRSVVDLSDNSCSGHRPLDAEYCHLSECYDEAVRENYAWSLSGYGLCSRSCAGGTQEATFACLRISDYTITKHDKCQHLALPRKPPRPCHEHRCPARWRAFPNGHCTASCGGGRQERSIRCIYDLDNGADEELPDDRCPSPKPPKLALCNMAPCPPTWNVDSWSECSVTCGRGILSRQVRCEQKVSLSTVATVNESLCSGQSPPPQSNQPCQRKDCPVRARQSVIREDPKSFSQLNLSTGKFPLLVGGTATFIPGTTIQVTCSVKHFNRALITWHRRDRELGRTGRVKVSPKGLLRIRDSRPTDAGLYTCRAGEDSASINITFTTELEARRMEQTKLAYIKPIPTQKKDNESQHDDLEHPISIKNLLRWYSPTDLPLQFFPHPWSACSKTCGGSGLESRDITCEVSMKRGYTLVVNDSYCHSKGLVKPIETRDCGYGSSALTCPSWDVGPWNECSDESCVRTGIGSRTRSAHCLAHNGSRLAFKYCSAESSPTEEEECEHENCSAEWTTSEWTKCSISCGGRGIRSRTVECVWEKTGKFASLECEQFTRPEATRPCSMPICSEHQACRDESKYCVLIPKLHMCRFPQYRHECCYSCSAPSSNGHQQVAPPSQSLQSRHHDVV